MQPEPDLLGRLAGFARLLHDAGLEAGPGRLTDAARALQVVDLRREDDFRGALRTNFVTRREELPIFDAAFDLFWAAPNQRVGEGFVPARRRALPVPPERARAWMQALGTNRETQREEHVPVMSTGYSAEERLRQKDFDQMTYEEIEQVRRLLQASPWRITERRTRRLGAANRGPVDLRRTARSATRSGELVTLLHRKPRLRRRTLVLICDVSGSMERYTRPLLIFSHAIARRQDVETFVFATRLTRITRLLRRRDIDLALEDVARSVRDFSGGTRIGEALHEFNRRWARRVLGHGAIVIVISDGWDRGDPELLHRELERLHRLAHRLIWLNPLKGSAGYEPLTRGMAAALPHVDDFLAAHSLEALDELGRLLGSLK